MTDHGTANRCDHAKVKLLVVVAVDYEHRIQCQHEGCGRPVYAAIHVVEDHGRLLVLGRDCYSKRYPGICLNPTLSGSSWGNGEKLSAEERELLERNTQGLLDRFTQRRNAELETAARLINARQHERKAPAMPVVSAAADRRLVHPWPWQHPRNNSVAVMRAPSGQHWVRVQDRDGRQMLAPWPVFDGWHISLPNACGAPDMARQAYAVEDIIEAIKSLRNEGFSDPVVGRWANVKPC